MRNNNEVIEQNLTLMYIPFKMKCSKNVMIGLMVVIGVILMVSLMSSPFMSGLEGFQEGNRSASQSDQQSSACKQFKQRCSEANRSLIIEMNKKRDTFFKNGDVNKDELKKPENKKYADVMKDTNCKEVFIRNCPV